jgi:outer membrane receptor protein involved in Fe transport
MRTNQKIARAVAAILGTQAGIVVAADQPAGSETGTGVASIQEVVVTAQRRSENVQDVPIAIQALSGETLQQLNVTTFEDLIKHLPNVSGASQGPGQVQIFMRGLSAGSVPTQSGGSINGFPNVALYLDEQSGQLPGRNLDVYAADLERIEVLAGPQGTLFGAGAQAGVIRYITNKPKIDKTEGSITADYGVTAGGDPNTNLTAMINLPLIADTLAVRAVIFNDRRGGYINNVPGTFTRKATDGGIGYGDYPTGCGGSGPPCEVPPGSPVINNYLLTGHAINPLTYQGLRVSALWQISDDWSALITQSYQNMDAEGVFYQMPYSSDGAPLPPQSVTLFNPSYNKDRFENTAWTFNGRIGALKAVYTGSYLVRNVQTVQDYTNYARGIYADYYQCHGPEPASGLVSTCYSPATTWDETLRNTHQSHEIRLSTPDDWRLRAIVGAFWENLRIYDQLNWNYKTLPPCVATQTGAPSTSVGCLTNIGPLIPVPGEPGSSLNNPDLIRGDHVGFFNDVKRGYTQRALFASVDFDIIPKTLTITAGTRYYHFDNEEKGAVVGSFYCKEAGAPPCMNYATNIDDEHLKTTYSGFKSRANLTWHFMADGLVYYTWSQGFRPGAFNRTSGRYIPFSVALPTPQYISPLAYESDNLINNEVGWKTEWLDHRLQWDGAVYQEDWKNAQVTFFQPGLLGNVGFNANGPDYRIRGLETSFIALITRGLTAEGGASWISSELKNSPFLIANNTDLLKNPVSAPQYGQPITYGVDHSGNPGQIPNPYGQPGDPAAFAPPLQFNARLRYQWVLSSYDCFAQVGATHTAHSYTQSGSQPAASGTTITTNYLRFQNPGYTQYDASIGAGKGPWWAKVYAQNLTNVLASTYTSTSQFALQETITRPRVLGLQFGYRF